MKRTILAVAVGAALGGVGQQALAADTNVVIYGHLDLSVDEVDNGLKAGVSPFSPGGNGAGALDPHLSGRVGWRPQISSNLSRIGIRGSHDLGGGLSAVFQVETSIDVSSEPQGKDGLAGRNSFVGFANPAWGAVKVGKTDLPYKLSTGRMDPFSATIGDYNSIMGNTGGDNRAEFDTRVPHVIWYESPNWSGFHLNAAFSPGQNRNPQNIGASAGEGNCPGGNAAPVSLGNPLTTGNNTTQMGSADNPPCQDGAWNNVFSAAGLYSAGPMYLVLAYELHTQVNREGDAGDLTGIGDERAWKAGIQYKIGDATTIDAIYENLHRQLTAPAVEALNERSRWGSWLALTQKITPADDISVGWAHAAKSHGDPGNDPVNPISVDNASNMYDIGYKHHFADKKTSFYIVAATQRNHQDAHYDLGASGHGVVADCHDNTMPTHHCFPGAIIKAVSVGMTYDF